MHWQPLYAAALLVSLSAPVSQPPAQTPTPAPAQPAPPTSPPAPRPRPATASRVVRPSLDIEVTDPRGAPLGDVQVTILGDVDREGVTDNQGVLRITNLRSGSYRLRFEREGFITLERECTVPAVAIVDVKLNAAPRVAAPPPPPTPPERQDRAETNRPAGEPRIVEVPSYTETNFIGRSEPQKLSVLGCTGYSTTRLLQVRDPLEGRVNADADETLYVVAGDASLRLGGSDRNLSPGSLAVIPRGITHALSRRGRNPAIFISVLSGPACAARGSQD